MLWGHVTTPKGASSQRIIDGEFMAHRFNPPPNWPKPPEGWVPPNDWRPDPSWGPPPEGWQLWVDDQSGQVYGLQGSGAGYGSAERTQPAKAAKASKPWYKRWWAIALGSLVAIVVIANLASPDASVEPTADSDSASNNSASKAEEQDPPAEEEAKPAPEEPQAEPEQSEEPAPEEAEDDTAPAFADGTHLVGADIEAGTYRSDGQAAMCYWERLSDLSGELDGIIANGNSAPEIVTIDAKDKAFTSNGCGGWVPVKATYPDSPASSFQDGTFAVGSHITPGTYRSDAAPDALCYWARLSNFSHAGIDGVITNGNAPTTIAIDPSDAGFTSRGCGTWTKIE